MAITYEELLKIKNKNLITYNDLLETYEWKKTREECKEKMCQICTYVPFKEPLLYGSYVYFGIYDNLYQITANDILGRITYIDGHPYGLTQEEKHLELHHKYYILNKLPWEYKEALITVCNECHKNIHETQKIPIYLNERCNESYSISVCNRCNGKGFLKEFQYHKGGTCFKCNGRRFLIPFKIY